VEAVTPVDDITTRASASARLAREMRGTDFIVKKKKEEEEEEEEQSLVDVCVSVCLFVTLGSF